MAELARRDEVVEFGAAVLASGPYVVRVKITMAATALTTVPVTRKDFGSQFRWGWVIGVGFSGERR